MNGPRIPGGAVEGFQELGIDGRALWSLECGEEGGVTWETERKGRGTKHLAWGLQRHELSINVRF